MREKMGETGIDSGNLRAGLAWYAVAHAALATAGALVALDPSLLLGPWQRAGLVAVVHLVTLGWIGSTIVGSLLILGQGVLRLGLVAGRRELVAAPLAGALLATLVWGFAHLRPLAIAASAGALALLFAAVAVRVLARAPRAPLPWGMRLAFVLSWSNLLLALGLGLWLAAGYFGFAMAGGPFSGRIAHAHLAAAGWAATLVVGAGVRLMPMVFPAAPPPQGLVAAAAAGFGLGAPALALALLFAPQVIRPASWILAAGALALLVETAWMLAHARPPAKELPEPDPARWLALAAAAALAVAAYVGVVLAAAADPRDPLEVAPGWPIAYGAIALIGFLGTTILAVELKILPTAAWILARRRIGYDAPFPSAHRLPPRGLTLAASAAFVAVTPLLAAGAIAGSPGLVRSGGVLLAAAPVLHAAAVVAMLARGTRA